MVSQFNKIFASVVVTGALLCAPAMCQAGGLTATVGASGSGTLFIDTNGTITTGTYMSGASTVTVSDKPPSGYQVDFTGATGSLNLPFEPSGDDKSFTWYNPSVNNVIHPGSATPEPSTWMMMLVGVGATGGLMRGARRRRRSGLVPA